MVLFIWHCHAESSTSGGTNKITPTKTTLTPVPSGSGKQINAPIYQTQHQPQYVNRAPMYIIAQPVASPHSNIQAQFAPNNAQFQQAVQQLLHYYETNPQAKLQLLNQQHGGYFSLAPAHASPVYSYPQQAYVVPQHQAYVVPQHVAQHVVPASQQQYQIAQPAQPHSNPHLEGMKVVPAPHLDRQPSNTHYIPASTTASSQHYIPALANGQFSLGPPLYHTIPQHYYNQPPSSPHPPQTQVPLPKSSESRNELPVVDKYQQSPATLVRSYYYKG